MSGRSIVRITRWSVEGGSARQEAEVSRWIIYGVDEGGVERVYAEHTTEAEHRAWCATDPLWRQAQQAMFASLLSNPKTRDTVLRINIAAALEAGDREMAMTLAQHLSAETWQRLLHGDQEDPPKANSQGSDHDTI